MTEATTKQIQDWVDNHPDTFGKNVDLVIILLNRLETTDELWQDAIKAMEAVEKRADTGDWAVGEEIKLRIKVEKKLKDIAELPDRWRDAGFRFCAIDCAVQLKAILENK